MGAETCIFGGCLARWLCRRRRPADISGAVAVGAFGRAFPLLRLFGEMGVKSGGILSIFLVWNGENVSAGMPALCARVCPSLGHELSGG